MIKIDDKMYDYIKFNIRKMDLATLYRVKRTQLEMVMDRGYTISERERELFRLGEEDGFMTKDEFIEMMAEAEWVDFLNAIYAKDGSPDLHVIYVDDGGKSKSGNLPNDLITTKVIEEIKNRKIRELIIISNVKMVSQSAYNLDVLKSVSYTSFTYADLIFNVTKHYLVPKHEGLSIEESNEWLKRSEPKITRSQLPVIGLLDPVSKYYGFKIGQIIKVYRKNLSFNTLITDTISWRVVDIVPEYSKSK